ncbi:MAG: 16S rRNA (cytidine1402-2'-O)-methyltransferase [Marinoscillum sp.]|jgi:16S rRNA (cytidine1402-2'-O)-methyltransferase
MEEGTSLYLVPTPIGNLGDFTFRAVEVLNQVDKILAEDTRTSGVLLKHYQIKTPTESFHSFNEHKKTEAILIRLKAGEKLALITDAGTPGISDPGFLLARAAADVGIKVECLPGATAFVPALVKSGLPSDKFVFEGFLPHKKGRQTRLSVLKEEVRTMVFYESPHRLMKTLTQFQETMGENRNISVSRELTKKFEETVNGTIAEVIEHFNTHIIKGEFVIILEGGKG